MQPKVNTSTDLVEAKQVVQDEPIEVVLPASGVEPSAQRFRREPGDFIVYKFSGNYREQPLSVTQRVVSRAENMLIVDVLFDDAAATNHLRLRVDEPSGEVLSVARVDLAGIQHPFGVVAFEELMSSTMLNVDDNEKLLGSTGVVVELPGDVVAATKTSYRVRVSESLATMHTLASDGFPWGDVGGEILADDGTLLYRAEIVDMSIVEHPAMAIQHEVDAFYDDVDLME